MHRSVDEIMTTSVVTITADATVDAARAELLDHRISALPIVDHRNRPTAIITKTDLVANVDADAPIALLMTTAVRTVPLGTTIGAAARLMRDNKIHHVIVTDESGAVGGIVSVFDILAGLDLPD